MHNQHKLLRVLQLIHVLKNKPGKSIQSISKMLETTERTVYRYLDLLAHVGFHISKDDFGKFTIDGNADIMELKFTTEEAIFIKTLCLTAGKSSALRDSILQKLYYHSDIYKAGTAIHHAYLSVIVERIQDAIHQKKQVMLSRYHSLNTNQISDRIIEPIQFTDNYQILVAYEPASKENKYFNIERIGDVKILKTGIRYKSKHEFIPPDVFGFAKKGKAHSVTLHMNMRAATLLKESYPMTAAHITTDKKSDSYIFKSDVYDLMPICRFVMSTLDDITFIGGKELKATLKTRAARMSRLNE
jgi:proteasome accessory factor C